MAPLQTTAGQVMLNEALPAELRDYGRELTRSNVTELMTQVAQRFPDQYRDISHKLVQMGAEFGYHSGGYSFGLKHLLPSPTGIKYRKQIQKQIDGILDDDSLDQDAKEKEIVRITGRVRKGMEKDIYDEQVKAGNPLAKQIASGVKGSPGNLRSLVGADLLYVDNKDRDVPMPVLESYAEGLSPASYLAGSYGARRGLVDQKRGTALAGFLGKRLVQTAHRLVVTGDDSNQEPSATHPRGLPASIDDPDNEGSLLAMDTGTYPRNTPLTARILSDLRNKGHKNLLVRSPTVGGPPDGGLYARDAGVREFSRLPQRGEFVGIAAAQSVGERVGQGALSSRHAGGVSGSSRVASGFKLLDQMTQIPHNYPGGATHAQQDGYVDSVEEAPQGGHYVAIAGEQHYVPGDRTVSVKPGAEVEAGDLLSSGLADPAQLVKHKGIGEGRKLYTEAFQAAANDAGYGTHRRNIEVLARGLIDHVRLTGPYGDHLPGDVVSYQSLEHQYKPRRGYEELAPKQAIGKYLESPVLHYTIGTKVRKSMVPLLQQYKIPHLVVHEKPPPFEPEMIRSQDNLAYDPDWQTQMLGSNLERNLLRSAHTGAVSDRLGVSYVPALAEGLHFGMEGKTKSSAAVTGAFHTGADLAGFGAANLPKLPDIKLPHLGNAHEPVESDTGTTTPGLPVPDAPLRATPSIPIPKPLPTTIEEMPLSAGGTEHRKASQVAPLAAWSQAILSLL